MQYLSLIETLSVNCSLSKSYFWQVFCLFVCFYLGVEGEEGEKEAGKGLSVYREKACAGGRRLKKVKALKMQMGKNRKPSS